MTDQASSEAIDVDVSMDEPSEKCAQCAKVLTPFNRDLRKPLCLACADGANAANKLESAFAHFARMPGVSREGLEHYGIASSALRILAGAVILGMMTYLASLLFGKS